MYQAKRVMKAAATVLAVLSIPLTPQCQFPPKPQGVTLVRSHLEEGVYITYKQVRVPVSDHATTLTDD